MLCPMQRQRLDRADQGFIPVALCKDMQDGFRMVLRGSSTSTYVLDCDTIGLACSCPDFGNNASLGIICKHLCWLLKKGTASINALIGDEVEQIVEQHEAVERAWKKMHEDMEHSNKQYSAEPEKCELDDCPICMELLATPNLCKKCPKCRNHFHTQCLIRCMQHSKACPLCRDASSWDALGWEVSGHSISML